MNVTQSTPIARWDTTDHEPEWLVNEVTQAVARLPKLTELTVRTSVRFKPRVPLGLFSNLSKLTIRTFEGVSFISRMATVIANSSQLRCLDVIYGNLFHRTPLPTLSELFENLSSENPLRLEKLYISGIDATVDQVTLPHLTRLTSFRLGIRQGYHSVVQSVWTSLIVNHVKLSDVTIDNIITKETMLYLSSFSGLKRLVVEYVIAPPDTTLEDLKNMFFAEVLPKHVNSLQTLEIHFDRWVKFLLYFLHVISSPTGGQAFNPISSKSIIKCLKLRNLRVHIGKSMPVVRSFNTLLNIV
jgi:hypothetical protein